MFLNLKNIVEKFYSILSNCSDMFTKTSVSSYFVGTGGSSRLTKILTNGLSQKGFSTLLKRLNLKLVVVLVRSDEDLKQVEDLNSKILNNIEQEAIEFLSDYEKKRKDRTNIHSKIGELTIPLDGASEVQSIFNISINMNNKYGTSSKLE